MLDIPSAGTINENGSLRPSAGLKMGGSVGAKEVKFEELLTIEELAEQRQFGIPFLRKAKDKYKLPHYKFGRLLRFRLSEVDKWIEERRQNGIRHALVKKRL